MRPKMRGTWIRMCMVISAAAVLLSGCGSSHDARKAPHHGQAVLSGNDLMPQCTFTIPVAGRRVQLIANISNAPSPYFVLERTAVEASQVFTTTPLFKPPTDITGLGLDADWFPPERHLMTTDGRVLVTVTVDSWQKANTAREIALTSAVARTYLGPNDAAAAKLYP